MMYGTSWLINSSGASLLSDITLYFFFRLLMERDCLWLWRNWEPVTFIHRLLSLIYKRIHIFWFYISGVFGCVDLFCLFIIWFIIYVDFISNKKNVYSCWSSVVFLLVICILLMTNHKSRYYYMIGNPLLWRWSSQSCSETISNLWLLFMECLDHPDILFKKSLEFISFITLSDYWYLFYHFLAFSWRIYFSYSSLFITVWLSWFSINFHIHILLTEFEAQS